MDHTKVTEHTIKNKLIVLKRLQDTFSQIDRIKQLRGELPKIITDLEDQLEGRKTRLESFNASNKALTASINEENQKISVANDELTLLREKLNNISNNREYESITRSIEFQELVIQLAQKKVREYNVELQTRKEDTSRLKAEIKSLQEEHDIKAGELKGIIEEHMKEEEKLRDLANDLEAQLQGMDERLLNSFKRLRQGRSNNGLAVVAVEREACGGCFNRIPPQRQLEVLQHNKVIVCEYCGRILVDEQIEQDIADTQAE